jgi:DNA-binding NtrC family response regulator
MDQPHSILVVDDEPALLRLMQTFLERQGYSVESAGTAGGALEIFRADPERFDVIVADLTLPDKPGLDMALEMTQVSARVKVLLCSGYPFAVKSLPREIQDRFAVLQKPFLPGMLTESVSGLLAK